jgi:Kazal-type serine protease inhibitor-like protein
MNLRRGFALLGFVIGCSSDSTVAGVTDAKTEAGPAPDGTVRDAAPPDVGVGPCGCPGTSDPVCGADGKPYGNGCLARCSGTWISCLGNCPCPDCPCPPVYEPVCGADGATYSNTCEAECTNVIIDCEGECPCPARGCGDTATCPNGFECICDGPGGWLFCRCGLRCADASDCTNLNQYICCGGVCTTCCCE